MQPNLGQGGCMAIEDALTLAEELTLAQAGAEGRPHKVDMDAVLQKYQDSRMMRAAAIHGMAGMAAMMASTYKAYLGEGLGPLSWIQRWKLPHPGRVTGQVALLATMPAVLAWVLGGNIGALVGAERPGACRITDGLKFFSEKEFELFMRDNDALLRATHARWMLLAERVPAEGSGADATSCSEAKGIYLTADNEAVISGAAAADSADAAAGSLLLVDDAAVSSARHARAWRDGPAGDHFLQHLAGAGEGTWVNGRRLGDGETVRLLPGDLVEFGRSPSNEVFKHDSLFCSALSGTTYSIIPAAGAAIQLLSEETLAAAAAVAREDVPARR
ncbi:zeaxanthin epoxidase [Monoraphidium neglectum]|uniref:Zeaxanthin epoxidase n=1 Tax=Monoraphidium neglectum TaxID=145388 RepID=A0A0D2L3B5_9CHLO|nr:zeaxanthin epoxidase [Monoraphidium neglectum]KIZ01704.1 zeaxanthin epoxidase [Monoraphidium neglectum]|eukprot:XP_013900723.1 zeaxanthin epoxidase [Monoraphidium neglectum]